MKIGNQLSKMDGSFIKSKTFVNKQFNKRAGLMYNRKI